MIIGYVDPGVGATLMQLILAGTVGIGVIFKLKWRSIRSLLSRLNVVRGDSSGTEFTKQSAENEELKG